MPTQNWIEPDRHKTAHAVPDPLPDVVFLKRPTNALRDAFGNLLLPEAD